MFFSRYPIEFEIVPFPGIRKVLDRLQEKYEVSYFSMGWSKGSNLELRKGLSIKEIPLKVDPSSSFDKWLKTILYYAFLPLTILSLKLQKPDVVICKETFPFVPYLLGSCNIPLIIETGDWWPSIFLNGSKLGRKVAFAIESSEVKRWNNLNCVAIAHTKAAGEAVITRGLKSDHIQFVPPPMFGGIYSDNKKENSRLLRKKLKLNEKDFIVTLHGIIHPSKGYDQVLSWWADLVKIHPDWKLLFIGGTMGEGWFNKMIIDLKLEKNVIMAGWISDQRLLKDYLNASDCLLVTRRNTFENKGTIPSGLTHSLMTGKPTVVTGMQGIREIVQDRKNGYLFEPDNYDSFKKSLEDVYYNQKKASKIGIAGIKRIKEYFDTETAAKRYDSIISKIIKKSEQ